jgi:L-amino acid N-acyltransferase YncA
MRREARIEDAEAICKIYNHYVINTIITFEEDPVSLARIFHESLAATTDLAVLPGVLGYWPLRRTVQVRLGTNPLRLPGGTPIFAVSRHQFMTHPG